MPGGVDFSGVFKGMMPNFGAGIFEKFILFLIIFVVFLILVGFIVYSKFMKKVFSHKVKIFGLVGNQPMLKRTDMARYIPLGKEGDRLFFFKFMKKYLPPPTIQTGPKEWWYWEREDGELINIGMQNVDEIQRKMGVKFVDTDMRMQRLGIAKNLELRHQKKGLWEEYGTMILNITFYVILSLMLIVLFTQFAKIGQAMTGAMEKADQVLDKIANLNTGKMERPTDTGTGGLIPAILPLLFIKSLWRHKLD